jgi:hypothetical protein
MTIHFINPQGRANTVTIKREDLPKLQALEGYTITKMETDFDFDLPEVPKVRIHRREFIECESCSA